MDIGESSKHSEKSKKQEEQKTEEKINFICKGCNLSESVHFFGKKPSFVKNIEFLEDTYVMKDPFSQPPTRNGKRSFTEYYIAIGSNCAICNSSFCKDCSIYYSKTFCFSCAYHEVHQFPLEVQGKIRKEYLAIKNR